ncbi:Uncharacterized protein dnm_043570 [Desulfonema magnum]|uniref:Uncharacterized protein n=1 Tax=Desulfonema magnum TaxID=45655 RepID=A0A975BNL5_9BACT|nr:Uncharacterized protein dnm_043570 [Desulfonema magnum]
MQKLAIAIFCMECFNNFGKMQKTASLNFCTPEKNFCYLIIKFFSVIPAKAGIHFWQMPGLREQQMTGCPAGLDKKNLIIEYSLISGGLCNFNPVWPRTRPNKFWQAVRM